MRTEEEIKAKLQHTTKMKNAEKPGSPCYALSCGAIVALEWVLGMSEEEIVGGTAKNENQI